MQKGCFSGSCLSGEKNISVGKLNKVERQLEFRIVNCFHIGPEGLINS
jgi:hypothetical protein